MASPIRNMTFLRYYSDSRPWDNQRIESPTWDDVETAIRRMENYCFPWVSLNTTDDDTEESIFNVMGGAGRWALFQMMGEWQYENPTGSDAEVRLWDSDQGYCCKEKNIVTDIEKVLRITKAYFETGSYENLDIR